ncbi:MAG: glycosyltransferase, partial [Myxococcota bacterium]
ARVRRHFRRRTRRWLRPAERVARVIALGGSGLRLATFPPQAVEQAIARHREILRNGAAYAEALLKRDHRARVTACRTHGRAVVVKEVVKGGWLRHLADCARGSPARRAWRAGHGLLARGISAAKPLAFLEQRRFGVPVASFLVMEDLRPALSVDRLQPGHFDRSALVEALVSLTIELHRHRIVHGDLRASHIFVKERGPGSVLSTSLIDLEGVRFQCRLSQHQRVRALAELNASLGEAWLSAGERRGAFERYAHALPFRTGQRAALAQIVATSLERRHVWTGVGCTGAAVRRPAGGVGGLRIALVHMRHAATGGTEGYMNLLASHLAASGHEVRVVCRSHEAPPHPSLRFVVLRNFALGSSWRKWAFAKAVEKHVSEASYDLVYGLGKTWTQDVIRLGGGCHATYLARAGRAALRPWQRLLGAERLADRISLTIEARALAREGAAMVVANSEMVKRDVMRRHAVPPERITVIRNGVDLARFRRQPERGAALRRECGFDKADTVILFLGSGYGRKGLDRVLDAFPELLRRRERARLLVAGYDSSQASYERRARRLGIEKRVCFLGGTRDTEACYSAADLYVLPTRYDPFATTTLEALAMELPVITSDANGAAELISDGIEGLVLAEPISREALSAALFSLTDRARLRAIAPAPRLLAERYPAAACMEQSEGLLQRVATQRLGRE